MQTTSTRPVISPAVVRPRPRIVETSRGTAHPEHERTRQLVVQSLLARADRMAARRA